jgi:hypothetical protein
LWNHVIRHFEGFLGELELRPDEREDAEGKAERAAKSLFKLYYPGQEFASTTYQINGSYAKGTATRPPTDIDILFVLPGSEYTRIEALQGNKQSQLLQEVRRRLLETNPDTAIKADGQAVVMPFGTYSVDVVPSFRYTSGEFNGQYCIADTTDGGRWRRTNPVAEFNWLQEVDVAALGKAREVVKMLKAWKRHCNVDLKSVCIEIAATKFVSEWAYRTITTKYFHDWMIRDFFAYILQYAQAGRTKPAGNEEWITMGDQWQTKARTAHDRIIKACAFERADDAYAASVEWQKVFGPQFHLDWLYRFRAVGIGA